MDGWNVTKLWVFKARPQREGFRERKRDANEKGLVRGVVGGADF